MKKIFDICGGIIHQPLDDMFVLARDGPMENMAIKNAEFFLWMENLFRHLKWKGFKFPAHL